MNSKGTNFDKHTQYLSMEILEDKRLHMDIFSGKNF